VTEEGVEVGQGAFVAFFVFKGAVHAGRQYFNVGA